MPEIVGLFYGSFANISVINSLSHGEYDIGITSNELFTMLLRRVPKL
jgi:hypothetical protein